MNRLISSEERIFRGRKVCFSSSLLPIAAKRAQRKVPVLITFEEGRLQSWKFFQGRGGRVSNYPPPSRSRKLFPSALAPLPPPTFLFFGEKVSMPPFAEGRRDDGAIHRRLHATACASPKGSRPIAASKWRKAKFLRVFERLFILYTLPKSRVLSRLGNKKVSAL